MLYLIPYLYRPFSILFVKGEKVEMNQLKQRVHCLEIDTKRHDLPSNKSPAYTKNCIIFDNPVTTKIDSKTSSYSKQCVRQYLLFNRRG